SSAMFWCNQVQVDGQRWNFEALAGPHSVVTWQEQQPFQFVNTTYTLDLCAPLKKEGPADESCPNGARVCGIKRGKRTDETEYKVIDVMSIAGDLQNRGVSKGLDVTATRLKTSDSTSDSKKQGVRIRMHGGRHPLQSGGREQRAIVEMLCDPDKTGKEGEWDTAKDGYEQVPVATDPENAARLRRRDEGDEGDNDDDDDDDDVGDGVETSERQLLKPDAALIFDSYGPLADDGNVDVLRLTWHTKLACEDHEEEGGSGKSGHWGFFTWLVILVFLGTASYLIFGSWLNYNRYGARGWDLLPHGDTLRDIPYLLKDWTRRVLNTVQGTGSRGGYSAV
ncbi:hypothetical protein M406DRAFT_231604, partial [Cryphonectria parasitica EP155]